MNGEARELRELAHAIEQLASQSRAYSMVAGLVTQLCDHICLRAHVMELEHRLRERQASKP
jgi:HPt (histidine-containing phosphotransfer) domain-containing protein